MKARNFQKLSDHQLNLSAAVNINIRSYVASSMNAMFVMANVYAGPVVKGNHNTYQNTSLNVTSGPKLYF